MSLVSFAVNGGCPSIQQHLHIRIMIIVAPQQQQQQHEHSSCTAPQIQGYA